MKNLLSYILIVWFSLGCETDTFKQLPPATQEGKNTFGCLVDGEVFIANRGGLFGSAIGVSVYYPFSLAVSGGGSFSICENEDISNRVYLFIEDSINLIQPDNFILSKEAFGQPINYGGYANICNNRYETFTDKSGELRISKLDTVNKIISGTFWFDAKSEDGEVVEIRDGRFDINYIPTR